MASRTISTMLVGAAMEICDCCKEEKLTTKGRPLGPKLYYRICDECAEQAKKEGSLARLWLEEMRAAARCDQALR